MTVLSDPVRFRKNLSKLVALIILSLMIIPSVPFPAHAQPSYLPGVVPGDTVTYGQVSGNVSPFNVSTSLVVTITSVVGVNVGVDFAINLQNGTTRSQTGIINVQTQQGNLSILIIAANLVAGDSLVQSPTSSSSFPLITETVSREYAGAIRDVNGFVANSTQAGQTQSFAVYWDKLTGLLLEITQRFVSAGPNSQNSFIHLKATSTNVWIPSNVSDFSFDAIPNGAPAGYLGASISYNLNLTSYGGFSGAAALTAQLTNSSLAHPPVLTLGSNSVSIPSGGSGTTTLTFSTDASAVLGAYLFSVHAASGSHSRDALFAVLVQPPSFQLMATPANLTIPTGATASLTITVRSLGIFTGPINLFAYQNDPSIMVTLSKTTVVLTSTITSANSTLSVAVGSYAIPGDHGFNVVASSGQNTQYLFLPVTVEGPHFGLSFSTTSLTLSPGQTAKVTATLTSISGFAGTIGLIDSSYGPAAVSLDQTSVMLSAGGISKANLTITVAPSAPPGSFISANIRAISGLLEQDQSVYINVPGTLQQFFISVNPQNLTLQPGQNGNFTISLTSNNGFSGHVVLAAQPNGNQVGYAFSSTNVTLTAGVTVTSILRVTVPGTERIGSAYINVYAESGNLTQQTSVYVNIGTQSINQVADFFLDSSPPNLVTSPDTTSNSTITITSLNGFTGSVNLNALVQAGPNNLCPGPSCPTVSLGRSVLSVSNGGSNSTKLIATVPATTPHPSEYNILVSATNGSISHFISVTLLVCPCPNFQANFNVNSLTVVQGTTVTPTLILSSHDGFSGQISLRSQVFGGCFGSTCPMVSLSQTSVFLPANGTATSTLTINTNSSTATNFFNVQVYANSTNQSTYAYLNFNVATLGRPDFTTQLSPYTLIISPGSAAPATLLVASINGFSGKIAFTSNAGQGLTISPAAFNLTLTSTGTATTILTVSAASNAPRGSSYVQLTGTSGTLSNGVYMQVIIAAPDFGASTDQTSLRVQAGGRSNSTVLTLVSLDGLQGSMSLQPTINPCIGGVCPIVSFSPLSPSLTSGGWTTSNITISAPLGTTAGNYFIAVNVTSQSVTHFVYLNVFVNASSTLVPDFSIFALPSSTSIAQGGQVSSTITLKSVNNLRGPIALAATVPPGITGSFDSPSLLLTPNQTNSTLLRISVASTTSTGFYTVRATATDGSLSHSVDIGVQVVGPDFSVEAKPNFVNVVEGKSAISTIVLGSLAGFSGTVNLSVSGSLQASFNANQVTLSPGGTASANLTISAFTNYPGYYYLTVTAFSGTVVHYVAITANVTGPDFRISATPPSLTIAEGSSAHSTILLTGFGGFSGPILLSTANYFGLRVSLTPTDVGLNATSTTATADLNVTVPVPFVPSQLYYAYVTASNGILSHSVYIPITVTGPDFSISASPNFRNVRQGNNATYTINLSSLDAFQGTVNLNANSGGLTTSLNSTVTLSPGGTGRAILAVSTTNMTYLGTHYVYVTGTSGILSHYVYVYVNVTGPDFSISTSQYNFRLMAGQKADATITVRSVDGFTGTVKLTGNPYGVTTTFSPANVTITPTTSANSTLTVSVPGSLSNGYYSFTVTGTSGILSHTLYYLSVQVFGPEFSISANQYPSTVRPGQTFSELVTLTSLNGFSGNVTLSVNGGGLTASLNSTSVKLVPGGTAVANLTITVPANIVPNRYYYVTLQGTNGTMIRSTTIYVYPLVTTPDFSISYVPYFPTIVAGSTGNFSVILTSVNGLNGTLSLNATSTNGFTTTLTPTKVTLAAGGSNSANLAVFIPADTLSGQYYVTVTVANATGTLVHSVSIPFDVRAANFTISAIPTSLSFQAGSSGRSIIDVLGLNGFSGTVKLAVSYNAQQLTASLALTSLEINSGLANSTTLTISTTTGTTPAFYQIVVNGTIGSISRLVTVTVYVTPSQIQPTSTTVACSTPIKVNNASTCIATVMSTATSGVTTPTGRVDFATNSTSGFFTSYCFLSVTGTTGLARCSVEYIPTVIGHVLVTGTYPGDTAHSGSSGNFTLTSIPNVVVQISGPSTGNVGSPLAFTAFVTGGVLPITFSWSAPGGSPSTGSTVGFSTTYSTTGLFTIAVNATDANGNSGTASANILIFPSGGQKLSLTVLVFNATATPIQGSTVVATTATTTNSSITDTTGSSVFTLSPGIYNVTAAASGYLSASQIVDLISNQTITLTLSNPYIFLGQIPSSHLTIQQVTGGFNIILTNMFASSPSNIVFDWHFMGTIPANATQSFFFDHLPQLIVMSALKGSSDYPYAWYSQPLPPGLNATTGQEGAFLPEVNPYNANSIFIIPNPPTAGQNTQIGVTLHNPFNHTLTISRIDFQVATLNIGTSTWQSIGQISNVTLAPGETRTFSVNWIATKSAHLCVRVVLHYSPSGIQVLQKNLVILNGNSVTFTVGDPFGFGGDFTLGFGGGCVVNINGQLVTSTITLHLAAGQQLTITLSGNCNVSESFGGSTIGGVVTTSSVTPDVELICPPDGFVGQPVTCSANVSGDISTYTFLWSTDGTPSTGTDSIFTTVYSTPGLHTVTVTLSSGGQNVSKSAQIMIFANAVTVASTPVVSAPGVTGATAYDTATVTSPNATGPTPTGSLRYDFYSTGDCSGTATSQTVSLASNGSVPASSKSGPLAAGLYSFKATYLGDSTYQSSPSSCETFTVNKAPTTVTTQVMNAGTGLAPSGNEITGSSFDDTATLKGVVSGFTTTGTVTYQFYSTQDCSGSPTAFPDAALNAHGSVPASAPTGALHAGNYSFTATYNGDSNYLNSPASSCELYTVHRAPTTVTTQVINNANGLVPFGTEVTGSSFRDTATLGGAISGFTPTGSVTYMLYANNTCAGNLVSPSETLTLTASGTLPESSSSGPLAAGNYRYQAVYSGDRDYLPSPSSPCETLQVLKAPTATATTLINAATGGLPSGTEVTGAIFKDNATIFGAIVGFTPSGNVRYRFWTNGDCSGNSSTSEVLDLTIQGGAPMSSTTRPLGAGNYSFQADYGGDSNYLPSQSACENFTILKAPTTTHTQIISGATGKAPTGTEVAGTVFFDTATVLGVNGFTTTGTVQYQFFMNANCSGSHSTTTVTLSNGFAPNSTVTVPLAAGGYSYIAVYSGDGNYTGSTSSGPTCESFNVAKIKPTVTTTLTPTGAVFAGQSVIDQATFGPNTTFQPTGSVTYTLTPSGTCTGPGGGVVATVDLSSGSIPNSGSAPLVQAGTFGFNATYGGDANNLQVTSSCETITVIEATPTIATSLSSSVIVARSSAFDTATLSGTSGSNSVGIVTYFVFTTSSGTSTGGCTGTAHTVSVVNVANSVVPISRSVPFNRTGTYGWDAVYSGDTNNNGATSGCETLTVTNAGGLFFNLTASPRSVMVSAGSKGTSTITLNSFNGFGRPVTLSFTVSPSTGLTCTLSRTRITGGSGTSTLSCVGSIGVYGVIVTGTGGPLTSSVMVTFNVTSTVGPVACGTGCSASILSDAALSQLSGSSASIMFTANSQKGAFAWVAIPITAVPDITALKVYLNGIKVQPNITSDLSTYFITVNFNSHNTYTINLQLQ